MFSERFPFPPQLNKRDQLTLILQLKKAFIERQMFSTVGRPSGWSNFYLRNVTGMEYSGWLPWDKLSKKGLWCYIAYITWCCWDKCMCFCGPNLGQVKENVSLGSSGILSNIRSFLKRQQTSTNRIYLISWNQRQTMGVSEPVHHLLQGNHRLKFPQWWEFFKNSGKDPQETLLSTCLTQRVGCQLTVVKIYLSPCLFSMKESEITLGTEKV